jgi:hypothetical protein
MIFQLYKLSIWWWIRNIGQKIKLISRFPLHRCRENYECFMKERHELRGRIRGNSKFSEEICALIFLSKYVIKKNVDFFFTQEKHWFKRSTLNILYQHSIDKIFNFRIFNEVNKVLPSAIFLSKDSTLHVY